MFMFLLFLIIGLAFWKGGDPFRIAGDVIGDAGKTITRFGDFVDDIKRGGKKVEQTYNQLKENIPENDQSPSKKK
jgi:hypothetical protein